MTTAAPAVPVHWTLDYKHLRVGATYAVVKPFRDFDRIERNVGDGFLYLGHNFFAREQGLTLYVAGKSGAFETWRLQCAPGEQGHIDDALETHLVADTVIVDQAAFMRSLAARVRDDNKLHRALGLELVARMPVVAPDVATAVCAHLERAAAIDDDEIIPLLMALYNVATPAHATHVEALRDRVHGEARTIAEAVLKKLASR